ncbi:hypothetical protein SAMN05216316_2851 [Nitrosovibrio sp. Nv6]|nr:hypothetical protein SAMN05216316_2851 [Nitrosovibrio sp. Nv6]
MFTLNKAFLPKMSGLPLLKCYAGEGKNHFGKTMIAAVYGSANGKVIMEILMRTYEGESSPGGLSWI